VPRPRSLSNAQLAAAALAVLDDAGLAGLTMRAVAKHLGMSTMGLYRYVDDRGELEKLVVESVLAAVDSEPPSDPSWRRQLEIMVDRVRQAVGAHPAVVPLTLTHRHSSPAVARWSETVLGILAGAGFDGPRRAVALRGLLSYVIGAILLQHLGPLSGAGTVAMSELPAAQFPYLTDTARYARQLAPHDEFADGLDILLRGLTSPET
jgi:AcrR family transcriptional regulator